MIAPNIRLITKSVQWFVCGQARISPRKEPTWGGPKARATKNRKLLGFVPLFFMKPAILFSFLQLFYFISALPSGEGEGHSTPFGCVPAAMRVKSGKIHYGMMEVKMS